MESCKSNFTTTHKHKKIYRLSNDAIERYKLFYNESKPKPKKKTKNKFLIHSVGKIATNKNRSIKPANQSARILEIFLLHQRGTVKKWI